MVKVIFCVCFVLLCVRWLEAATVSDLEQKLNKLQAVVDSSIPVRIRDSPLYGRTNVGSLKPFSDIRLWKFQKLTGLRMRCGLRALSLSLRYGSEWGPTHGWWNPRCVKTPTTTHDFTFGNDEWINSVKVASGFYVNSFQFVTNKRTLPVCGTTKGAPVETTSGRRLEYISGTSACWFDNLKFHWAI